MIAEQALHIQSFCILPLLVKTPLDDITGLIRYLAKACGGTTDNPIGTVMEVGAGDRDNKMMFFMFTGSE